MNVLLLSLFILLDISQSFAKSSSSDYRNEWDLLMLIEQKYKIGLEISDSDFMLNLTNKNHSFKIPAQTVFENRVMPSQLFVYIKIKPKAKSFTLLSIRDPDHKLRFQIRAYERRGQFNEYRMGITIDPLEISLENAPKEFLKTFEFTVPYLYSQWRIGILIEDRKVTLFTTCDDVDKPLGYHHIINTAPLSEEIFKPGATLHLFGDGHPNNRKDKYMGTVSEFIISNQTRLKEFMCGDEIIEGSGTKVTFRKIKFLGNVLITNASTTSTTNIPTTTKETTVTSRESTTAYQDSTSTIKKSTSSSQRSTSTPKASTSTLKETTVTSRESTPAYQDSTSTIKKSTSSSQRSTSTPKASTPKSKETTVTTSIDKGQKPKSVTFSYNGSDCECLRMIRLSKPEKGSNGIKGIRGEKGSPGIMGHTGQPGMCSESQCRPISPLKGNKGDIGQQGYCSDNICLQHLKLSTGPKGDSGEHGSPGQKGEKGDKLRAADIISSVIPDIRASVEDLISKNIKTLKGEPGSCSCSDSQANENKKPQMQTMILNDAVELKPIASTLSIGQMVFLIVENVLLIKVDEVKNRWRMIKMDDAQTDWHMPIEGGQMMSSQLIGQGVNMNGQSMDTKRTFDVPFKLMLVALPRPTKGDLISDVREPGSYSGSSYLCQKEAYNHGLGRAFYPLINTDTFDLMYMVPDKYRFVVPIVNRKSERIAQSFEDLIKFSVQITAPILDFKGNSIMSTIMSPCVWIGRKPTLYESKHPSEEGLCLNWMSRQINHTGFTTRLVMGRPLLDVTSFEETSCRRHCHILCMQIYPLATDPGKQ